LFLPLSLRALVLCFDYSGSYRDLERASWFNRSWCFVFINPDAIIVIIVPVSLRLVKRNIPGSVHAASFGDPDAVNMSMVTFRAYIITLVSSWSHLL
jgi:hypothetical protein